MVSFKDVRNLEPPKGHLYGYTRWGGVIHIAQPDGVNTLCGWPVVAVFSSQHAIDTGKNMCNGCNTLRYQPKKSVITGRALPSTHGKAETSVV